MKPVKKSLAAMLLTVAVNSNAFAAGTLDNTLWKTMDDVTGQPKSIVRITETATHQMQGTIVKVFPRAGVEQNELCTACKGPLRNKPIIGITVLSNLTQDKDATNRWSGGQMLDPKNGKSYRCTIQLMDNSQELNVRGYIGMPLFGRTQTWHRVTDVNG